METSQTCNCSALILLFTLIGVGLGVGAHLMLLNYRKLKKKLNAVNDTGNTLRDRFNTVMEMLTPYFPMLIPHLVGLFLKPRARTPVTVPRYQGDLAGLFASMAQSVPARKPEEVAEARVRRRRGPVVDFEGMGCEQGARVVVGGGPSYVVTNKSHITVKTITMLADSAIIIKHGTTAIVPHFSVRKLAIVGSDAIIDLADNKTIAHGLIIVVDDNAKTINITTDTCWEVCVKTDADLIVEPVLLTGCFATPDAAGVLIGIDYLVTPAGKKIKFRESREGSVKDCSWSITRDSVTSITVWVEWANGERKQAQTQATPTTRRSKPGSACKVGTKARICGEISPPTED